jgi:hypothetical protein
MFARRTTPTVYGRALFIHQAPLHFMPVVPVPPSTDGLQAMALFAAAAELGTSVQAAHAYSSITGAVGGCRRLHPLPACHHHRLLSTACFLSPAAPPLAGALSGVADMTEARPYHPGSPSLSAPVLKSQGCAASDGPLPACTAGFWRTGRLRMWHASCVPTATLTPTGLMAGFCRRFGGLFFAAVCWATDANTEGAQKDRVTAGRHWQRATAQRRST